MNKIPTLSFESKVRTIEPKKDKDRFSVSFEDKPAYYWVDPNKNDIVEQLHGSHKNKSKVVVEWNPLTLEVTKITPL